MLFTTQFHRERAEMFTAQLPRARSEAHAEILAIASERAHAYADAIAAEHTLETRAGAYIRLRRKQTRGGWCT